MGFQDSLVFRADFNQRDRDGLVKTSLYHGSSRRIPREGERVFLRDGEGNRCWAVVREVRGVLVLTEPDLATWVSAPETATQPSSAAGPVVALSAE